MFSLPLELQLMTIENVQDYDSLVALYDSLPSTSADVRTFLLRRIFEALKSDRLHRLETLQACRLAVFDMRDLLGIESLVDKFQSIIDDIDGEMSKLESAVEFRGLTHPNQGLTSLKKANMRGKCDSSLVKSGRQQLSSDTNGLGDIEHDLSSGCQQSNEQETEISRQLWMQDDGKFCLSTFMDRLYQQQLLGLAT